MTEAMRGRLPPAIDPIDVFTERAAVRAYLWSIGEYSRHEAVDVLQADAERDGLVERCGQDEIQEIMSGAFAPYQADR